MEVRGPSTASNNDDDVVSVSNPQVTRRSNPTSHRESVRRSHLNSRRPSLAFIPEEGGDEEVFDRSEIIAALSSNCF